MTGGRTLALMRCVGFLTVPAFLACSEPPEQQGPLPHIGVDPCQNVVCKASDPCHGVGVCDPDTGECSTPRLPDGTACDDGDACTYGDRCQEGVCGSRGRVVCRPIDDCHEAGECDPQTGCSEPAKPNGASCSDSNACTRGDQCQEGVCVGEAIVCEPGACHESNRCNTATGVCDPVPMPNGTRCEVGANCVVGRCVEGACMGEPLVCAAIDDCHRAGECDPGTGRCSTPPKENGTACDDGNACTEGDSCQAGVCRAGEAVVCVAKDACHLAGRCDPLRGCNSPLAETGTICDDGNPCTATSGCVAGVCIGLTPVTCTASGPCRMAGECDPATGQCTQPSGPDGTPCDVNNLCREGGLCQSGECVGGTVLNCPPPDPDDTCKGAGICDPTMGCTHTAPLADNTPCDDGDPCTLDDVCMAGRCTAGASVACEAIGPCFHAGTCDPLTGTCSQPIKEDGAVCDDEDLCTTNDRCQSGICVPGATVSCLSASCLASPVCDPATGRCVGQPAAESSSCDDGDPCSVASMCHSGRCVASVVRVCSAANSCLAVGECDPVLGRCTNPKAPNGPVCDAGLCFQDVSTGAGLEWASPSDNPIPVSAGAAVLDYDGDKRVDVVIAGQGGGLRLYQNLGDFKFRETTQDAGLGAYRRAQNIYGTVAADYDNDGDSDLLVLVFGRNPFFRNNGDGTFTEIGVSIGLDDASWTLAADFADYDNDGHLDLYLGNYILVPSPFGERHTPFPNVLYHNRGDGTFEDVTMTHGVGGSGTTSAVRWSDFDGDGFVDLWVCNDFGRSVAPNQLYRHGGKSATADSPPFVDDTTGAGVELAAHCQAIAAGDYDHDGDLDYYLSVLEDNALFSQDPKNGEFSERARDDNAVAPQGCDPAPVASWSAIFQDFDGDGWLDLYLSNGEGSSNSVRYDPNGASIVLRGSKSGFTPLGTEAGLGDPRPGRGVVTADFDGDGDPDILQLNYGASPVLYRNDSSTDDRWIRVDLTGTESNRAGIGARIEVSTATRDWVHEVSPQAGHGTSSELRAYLGLGAEPSADLTIHWPSGTEQRYEDIARGTDLAVTEPPPTPAL